jgi:hypothetical protein
MCEDVRFELGGTMTLVGVFADRLIVGATGDRSQLVLPRMAFYTVVAGLIGVTEIAWRQTLGINGASPGPPLVEGIEPHDPTSDEHRFVHFVSPLILPGVGRYRLGVEIKTALERHVVDHEFEVETATTTAP